MMWQTTFGQRTLFLGRGVFRAPKRGIVTGVGRLGFNVLRVPLAAAGFGTGATAYIVYRVKEFKDEHTPDWLSNGYDRIREWASSLDFSTGSTSGGETGAQGHQQESPLNSAPPDGPSVESAIASALQWDQDSLNSNDFTNLESLSGLTDAPSTDLIQLTRRLIEIGSLLSSVSGGSSMLQLPSIVVIGSQSSGKSSLLEAIVGHEFLPKGKNMVTRRPVELTLVHTPESELEYGEFPQLGLGKVSWERIKKTLVDLNLAVSPEECVTKDPIRLRISSPNVPDLSLVDLPGYIQITTKDQPAKLKEKIGELCDYYITKPNIILAVSAADVDLANSEALRASKKVDPEGRRTIGVLTKMDLVDPEMGVKLLSNQDYHLPLGYIGVICRSLAQKGNKSQQEPDPESTFFTSHSLYENAAVGVPHLRQRLTTLLESRMVQSLSRVFKAVEAELEATRYRFKVEYNDRGWSPESYTLEAIDSLKHRLKEFVQDFDKARVKGVIQELLLDKVTEVSRQRAWKEGELPNSISKKVDMELLNRLIEAEAGMITKAGVGKLSVDQTVNLLLSSMQNITEQYPWTHHSSAKEKILQTAKDLLQSRVKLTVEQIENMIKPFKTTIDYSPSDWKNGQSVAAGLMDKELEKLNKELNELTTEAGKQTNGKRKLRCAIQYLQRTGSNTKENIPPPQDIPIIVETPTRNVELSEDLLAQGRKALSLENQIYFLRQRKRRLISSSCSSKALCPEVYLSIISDKLTYTSILFIYFELLNDFFASLPRALEQSLYHQVTQEGLESFARENPEVRKYLELQDKNEKLELIVNKLKAMM